MTKQIHTGVLREIVKDQSASGSNWIEVPQLLHRLDLDDPLYDIRSRLAVIRSAIGSDDDSRALLELEFVEGALGQLLAD